MNAKEELSMSFYQNLGKLFYAIAAADNVVRGVEYNKLKQLIHQQWLNIDGLEDIGGSDAAFQIERVFDWLKREENLDYKSCFNDFVYFKKQHIQFFNPSINSLILKTANAIAESFSGKNKSELILLAKLQSELKKKTYESQF